HPFFGGIVRAHLLDVCGGLSATAHGTYRCEEQEEARLTNDILRFCRSGLKAVSYQDEKWWSSSYGAAFVKLQKEARQRGLSIVRIFIVRRADEVADPKEKPSDDDLRKIESLLSDTSLHSATFRVSLADVPDAYRRDFVIYDDAVLKSADFIPGKIEK